MLLANGLCGVRGGAAAPHTNPSSTSPAPAPRTHAHSHAEAGAEAETSFQSQVRAGREQGVPPSSRFRRRRGWQSRPRLPSSQQQRKRRRRAATPAQSASRNVLPRRLDRLRRRPPRHVRLGRCEPAALPSAVARRGADRSGRLASLRAPGCLATLQASNAAGRPALRPSLRHAFAVPLVARLRQPRVWRVAAWLGPRGAPARPGDPALRDALMASLGALAAPSLSPPLTFWAPASLSVVLRSCHAMRAGLQGRRRWRRRRHWPAALASAEEQHEHRPPLPVRHCQHPGRRR